MKEKLSYGICAYAGIAAGRFTADVTLLKITVCYVAVWLVTAVLFPKIFRRSG